MSLSVASEGEQTAVISTEHTLATITAAGSYELEVDLGNMAASDTVELRLKTKVRAGGTSRLADYATYSNAQADPNPANVRLAALGVAIELVATLTQTAGTGRAFPWSLRRIG